MVRLEEVEDETFNEKPQTVGDEALLVDDDADYTDTDSDLSDTSDLPTTTTTVPDESILDRISALRDIIPPQTRAYLSTISQNLASVAGTTVTYGGKSLWVVCTSMLLLGLPYALAFQEEQMVQEEERQRQLMSEGASGLMGEQGQGQGGAKAAL